MVVGKIFIQCTAPTPCQGISLEISGKEKNKFYRFWTTQKIHSSGDPNVPPKIEYWEHQEKLKVKNKFIHFKTALYMVPGGCIAPGSYCLGFTFEMPKNVPSSIFFKGQGKQKPKAKVKYCLTAMLEGAPMKIKSKQILMVRGPPVKFKENDS
jgi:hypothetical protein